MYLARTLSLPLALLVLFGIVAVGCAGVPQKNAPDDPAGNFVIVTPGELYRGGRPDEAGYDSLVNRLHVKTVINLENDDAAVTEERAWAEERGIEYVNEPMTGTSSPNDEQVNRILAMLADKEIYPVFVHCMQGHDRTGAIIALHRRYNEGWSAQDAYKEMEEYGFNGLLFALKGYVKQKLGM
jgi:protein tyrosine/serine phosphatase